MLNSLFNNSAPDELLKKATKQKKAGKLDEAIVTIRKALKKINDSDIEYSADTYLRLPLYLQQAGRNDEAWNEFHELLTFINSSERTSNEVKPMKSSQVYDKMRLFLQREKRFAEAFKLGWLSYIHWCLGLFLQDRLKELIKYKSNSHITQYSQKLGKKLDDPSISIRIIPLIQRTLETLPNVDFSDFSVKLGEKLNSSEV